MAPVVIYLVLLVLVSHWPLSSARSQLYDPPSTSLHKRKGYQLIEELNLHPKLDVNVFKPNITDSASITGSRVVEKPFRLPILPGSRASLHDLAHYAGYVSIKNTVGARIFYYFFKSRNMKDDPVVIWLTGGPGCSSAVALFYENGPLHLTSNLSLVWTEYGWDKIANMIYIDQPTGTGFSYSPSEKDIRHDEKGVSDDLYEFLQEFFKFHPEYVKNDLYITGESYGGHYIPAFAVRINQGNKNKDGIHLNLKGFAIGNGLTEPGIQFKAYTDFALRNHLINRKDYKRISQITPKCEKAIKKCGINGKHSCLVARKICWQIINEILDISNICPYDLRKQSCYDFSGMNIYLSMPSVKEALGIPKIIDFDPCSGTVYKAMTEDFMRNLEVGLPALLEEGIKMLVYAGEYDFICNWLGNIRWVYALKWSGQPNFEGSSVVQFKVDGEEAGLFKNHGPLTFLKVHDAGHMVPMDQPKASLQMLKMWIEGKLTVPQTEV